MKEWHKMSVAEVSMEFGTDAKVGRTNLDPKRKRKHANIVFSVPTIDRSSIIREMASDASLLLLAVTYLITAFTGHFSESAFGMFLCLSVFVLACYIKYRSSVRIENAYKLLLPVVNITEDGNSKRLSVFDVEVGDLISFSRGDIIPADARLLNSNSLKVAQRKLNSESGKIEYVSLDKSHDILVGDDDGDRSNCVYAGSMVISGSGHAVVTAVGQDTMLWISGEPISIARDNDQPQFLKRFNKEAKRISITVLAMLIPLSLVALFRQTANTAEGGASDLLYTFTVALALAVTSLSDLVIRPAESIVTKEILPSSRHRGRLGERESRITKLSAAESLANTDTVLILSPEVLTDKNELVRHVYFAGKSFRFDSLGSAVLADFATELISYYLYLSSEKLTSDEIAVKKYLQQFTDTWHRSDRDDRPSYLRDSSKSTRICVFEKDSRGLPVRFIAQTTDINMIYECTHFRNEGGSIWKIDRNTADDIKKWYDSNIRSGHRILIYISSDGDHAPSVFEGMLAVGDEYPYNDGFSSLFEESGIDPILVLESENEKNLDIARRCGIAFDDGDIAIASEYAAMGLSITDAAISTKVYVGFGKQDTKTLLERLKKYGKTVLPIIRDSVNRQTVAAEKIYAVHDVESYDSVKLNASVILRPADAIEHRGGLIDAFNIVKHSSMAWLKLGIYRNYLLFSLFLRLTCVGSVMVFGDAHMTLSSVMILFAGFLTDYIALFSVMYAKSIPVRTSETAENAERLYSHSLIYLWALSALSSSVSAVIIANHLISINRMALLAGKWFVFCSLIAASVISLGAFLLILTKQARKFAFNYVYMTVVLVTAIWLFLQSRLPDAVFEVLSRSGITKIDLGLIPWLLIPGAISFICILLVNRLLSLKNVFGKQ